MFASQQQHDTLRVLAVLHPSWVHEPPTYHHNVVQGAVDGTRAAITSEATSAIEWLRSLPATEATEDEPLRAVTAPDTRQCQGCSRPTYFIAVATGQRCCLPCLERAL